MTATAATAVELSGLLTVAETAQLLRVSASTVYRAVARGELPAVKVGRNIRIPAQALQPVRS